MTEDVRVGDLVQDDSDESFPELPKNDPVPDAPDPDEEAH